MDLIQKENYWLKRLKPGRMMTARYENMIALIVAAKVSTFPTNYVQVELEVLFNGRFVNIDLALSTLLAAWDIIDA